MEFAAAALMLVPVMIAIIEFGMIMFVTVLMEGGLREAACYGITGRAPESGDRASQILAIVADRTLGLVDISKATISITAYPTFDGVGKGEDFVDGNRTANTTSARPTRIATAMASVTPTGASRTREPPEMSSSTASITTGRC